jgi:hypothetical protein
MTAVLEHTEGAKAAPYPAAAASVAAIKETLADAWPPAMIGVGLLLTAIWNGGLLWLLLRSFALI